MSVQHIWNLFQLLGLFTCCKLVNLFWNFVTETCKQRPETIRRRLCCEKLGTSHDVKGFAIGSFLEHIVVERANDNLCQKNVSGNRSSIIYKIAFWISTLESLVFTEHNEYIRHIKFFIMYQQKLIRGWNVQLSYVCFVRCSWLFIFESTTFGTRRRDN